MNIKELAEQAGMLYMDYIRVDSMKQIERFAELVAAHTLMNIDPSKFIGGYQEGFEAGAAKEREECAKLCDVTPPQPFRPSIEAAHAIRARSKA